MPDVNVNNLIVQLWCKLHNMAENNQTDHQPWAWTAMNIMKKFSTLFYMVVIQSML